MNAHVAQIQALISEIDEVLVSPRPRLSWVMGDSAQRRILERIRSYLISLAETLPTEFAQREQTRTQSRRPPNEESLVPVGVPSLEGSLSTSAQQVWRSLVEEMSALQTSLVQPLHTEIDHLQQQRQTLLEEVKQLEIKRQHLYSLAQQTAGQQQIISDFLQAFMGRLEENINAQVRASFTKLETELFNQVYLPHRHQGLLEESAAEDFKTPLLNPAERVKQLRMLQARSDELLMTLDSTLNVVCDALQRNVQGYQDSLARAVEKINRGSVPGDVMVATLVNRLAEKLGQEVSAYVHSTLDQPGDAVSVRTDTQETPDRPSRVTRSAMVSEEPTAADQPSYEGSAAVDAVNLSFDFSLPAPETPVADTLSLAELSGSDEATVNEPFPYAGSEWPFPGLESLEQPLMVAEDPEIAAQSSEPMPEISLVEPLNGLISGAQVQTPTEIESATTEFSEISETVSAQAETNLNELYESFLAAEEPEPTEPEVIDFAAVANDSVQEEGLGESLLAEFPLEVAVEPGTEVDFVENGEDLFGDGLEMSDRMALDADNAAEMPEFETPESLAEALFDFEANTQNGHDRLTPPDLDIDTTLGEADDSALEIQPITEDAQLFYGLSPAFDTTPAELFHGDAYIPASPDEDLLVHDQLSPSAETSLEIDHTTLEQLSSDLSFLEDFERLDFQDPEENLNLAQDEDFTLTDWPDDDLSGDLNATVIQASAPAQPALENPLGLNTQVSDRLPVSSPTPGDEEDLFGNLDQESPSFEESEDTDFDWSILEMIDADAQPEPLAPVTADAVTLDDIFASLTETSSTPATDPAQPPTPEWSDLETAAEAEADSSLDDLFSSFLDNGTSSLDIAEGDLDWLALDAIAPDSEPQQRN